VVYSASLVKQTRALKREHGDTLLTLAGVFVNFDDEAKHFKIMSTTGSGKSTAIRELIDQALKRCDRAVIADPGGDYTYRTTTITMLIMLAMALRQLSHFLPIEESNDWHSPPSRRTIPITYFIEALTNG
jgi:type II secretory pathway predicted ATPase ExeA